MLSTNSDGSAAVHDGHSSGITTSGSSASQNGHLKSMHALPRGKRASGSVGCALLQREAVIETPA